MKLAAYFSRVKYLIPILIFSISYSAHGQYWQQHVDYRIDVQLNEKEKTLQGFERLVYSNNSPDTLKFIWFHLWPNAYRNDKTAFSEQLLKNDNTEFYFSSREQKGYINRLDFKIDGVTARIEDHPEHLDIIKVLLPKPLVPGTKATITTPFHVKLPPIFSRSGYASNSFQITQWYPKPAVYDAEGWHPMPYLDQGEFYSEFGSFDVHITVPKDMVVAATGNLQNKEEKLWLKTRMPSEIIKVKKTGGSTSIKNKKKKTETKTFTTEIKTLQYVQDRVHDFAWFASRDFVVVSDTLQLNEQTIEIFSFFRNEAQKEWKATTNYAKDAIKFYSQQVGQYPFEVVSVVQGPEGYNGGMEYPTITIIDQEVKGQLLDVVIAHEIGHNWFYGILGSNERAHPWMDEGLNSFYERKYERAKYGPQSMEAELFFQTKAKRRTDQPMITTSEDFSAVNYGIVAYYKTAVWLEGIETIIGPTAFRSMMQSYYDSWKFKHPQPVDLTSIIAEGLGADSTEQLGLLYSKGILPGQRLTGFKIVSPFKKNSIRNFLYQPSKEILFVSPAIGSNHYDKFMLGALFTNYKLPPSKFNYLVVPMYAFGSKKFVGLGKLNYSISSGGWIRKTDVFFNASTFSRDDFADTAGRKIHFNFQKLVPGLRLTFREANAKSSVRKYLQWKTFLIGETSLRIRPDTLIQASDTSLFLRYLKPKENRFINQLKFVIEDQRALYPFHIQLQVEHAKEFIRPTLTTNHFFNYAKKGGLSLRFFAGKFIYLGEKTIFKQFGNERYHLNLTGPNGYEDYTYSNYFIGRSEFEGMPSQQIMIRDGGFKVRTDLLANKIGKTDDWLVAFNLKSSVPEHLNPLNVLPFKIPLHVFFDLGTYAEPWQKGSEEDRFLYNAGLQLSLFGESLHIYIPIAYNKVFGDYIKSTIPDKRFLKTISFSIDFFNNKGLKKINRELEF